MADDSGTLSILIDIRAKLEELARTQKDMAGLTDQTRKAGEEANKFGAAFKTGLGIEAARRGIELLTSTLRQSVAEAFRMAGAIKDQAENLGVSTDAYQVLGQVIRDAGGDMSLLTQLISQNNRSLAEARNLSGGASAAYRTLGLDPAMLEGLAVEGRLERIGRAILDAKDQTAAYGAASQIVGSRNLPTLLGALKSLANDGYGPLAAAARNAGQVMERDTIYTLERAMKQIEKAKQQLAIGAGKAIGDILQSDPDALPDGIKALGMAADWLLVKWGRAYGVIAGNLLNLAEGRGFMFPDEANAYAGRGANFADRAREEKEEQQRRARAEAAGAEAVQKQALADAEYDLARAVLAVQQAETDPLTSNEAVRREQVLKALAKEIAAREKLLALQKQPSLDTTNTEDPNARRMRIFQGEAGLSAAQNKAVNLKYPQGARAKIGQAAAGVEDPIQNTSFLSFGQGFGAGADQWISSLGSRGEQVAAAMQSSIGATVSSISEGIMGWVIGAQNFGEVVLNLGSTLLKTLLDTIVQMGVQWLVSAAIAKTSMIGMFVLGSGLRKAEAADTVATEATKTPVLMTNAAAASASSFGLSAVIGIALLAALVGAMIAGFRADGGPVDANRAYVVGERGPELFLPGASGNIIANHAIPAATRATPVAAGSLSVGASGTAGGGGTSNKTPRLIAIVPDLNSARALQRDPNFESVIIDVVQRRRGEILG